MLAQEKDRDNLHLSNDKLRDEIVKLEEKLCQWKAEQSLAKEKDEDLNPMHAEEMESVTNALRRANQDCEQLKYVVMNLHFMNTILNEYSMDSRYNSHMPKLSQPIKASQLKLCKMFFSSCVKSRLAVAGEIFDV